MKTIRNLEAIRQSNPLLAEALDDIILGLQNVSDLTNAPLFGQFGKPPQISSLSVTAAGGIFDIQVTDNNFNIHRGIHYFVEYSASPAFTQPIVMNLGTTRNARVNFGNQTFYFRAFSQYLTSPPSDPIYFGTSQQPTAVNGGGATSGPNPQSSTGSGTAKGDGRQGARGFGKTINRDLE